MCLRPQAVSSGVGRGGHTKDRLHKNWLVAGLSLPLLSLNAPLDGLPAPVKSAAHPTTQLAQVQGR